MYIPVFITVIFYDAVTSEFIGLSSSVVFNGVFLFNRCQNSENSFLILE